MKAAVNAIVFILKCMPIRKSNYIHPTLNREAFFAVSL